MIFVVDYGMGNLNSIVNMLRRVGAEARITNDVHDVETADKLILPGVGAFDVGMKQLQETGLIGVLRAKVLGGATPTLGICLGMQLFMQSSEEGKLPGLGWIEGQTVRFRLEEPGSSLKVPHMGWNTVSVLRPHPLFLGLEQDARFYFVHSYRVVCADEGSVLAVTNHGLDFPSAVQQKNIVGTQFHPEKSHRYGMRLLQNFVEMV